MTHCLEYQAYMELTCYHCEKWGDCQASNIEDCMRRDKEGPMNIGEGISGAVFLEDKRYRLALWRIWNKRGPNLLFIGLNPSTAAETRDDPTVVRMVNFAKSWGYGGLFVGNLFSIVSADPNFVRQYLDASDIAGRPDDQAIKFMRDLAEMVVVGWGEWGKRAGRRPAAVMDLVGEPVYCFKVNRSGEPAHPLYLPGKSKPIRYYRKGTKEGVDG